MMREYLVDVVARLPQGAVSRAWGWLARQSRPKLAVTWLKRSFAGAVGVDMREAKKQIDDFGTLEEFFVRELLAEARPIDADPMSIVSPTDGTMGVGGIVQDGTMLQVKGRNYSLSRLLGSAARAKEFEGGAYATVYLAPRDYHRVHAPVAGRISSATLIPGSLMPVFLESLEKVEELFARNERIVTYMDSSLAGRVAVVKVGATLVGRIAVAFDASLRGNTGQSYKRHVDYESPVRLEKGQELGAFELGSTVVIIGQKGRIVLNPPQFNTRVLMGQRIGIAIKQPARRRPKSSASPKTRHIKG